PIRTSYRDRRQLTNIAEQRIPSSRHPSNKSPHRLLTSLASRGMRPDIHPEVPSSELGERETLCGHGEGRRNCCSKHSEPRYQDELAHSVEAKAQAEESSRFPLAPRRHQHWRYSARARQDDVRDDEKLQGWKSRLERRSEGLQEQTARSRQEE